MSASLSAALTSANRTRALRTAYRHLYRAGLRAVCYSYPSREVLKSVLRNAFRRGKPEEFQAHRIVNTLQFLERAREVKAIEHKILKNLLRVRFWQQPLVRNEAYRLYQRTDGSLQAVRGVATQPFEQTLHRLNESLQLCLR